MVVVAVREAEKVGNLGGAVLYIVTEPLAQLSPPQMDVFQGLRYNLVGVWSGLEGSSKGNAGVHRRSREGTET